MKAAKPRAPKHDLKAWNMKTRRHEDERSMKPALLSEQQQRLFEENGYLVVPNALPPEQIQPLERACDAIAGALSADNPYVQIREGVVQTPEIRALLAQSPVLPYIVQLLSPNIQLHTAAVIYKHPEPENEQTRTRRGWHRDAGITEDLGHRNLPRVGVKAGYCLTDFPRPRSGFTLFAPGSHLIGAPLPIPKGKPDPENAADLTLNAGDAFLFENRVFHTAAPNLSQRVSKAVILGYAYRWLGGRKEAMRLVQPDDTILEQTGGIGKQLLGGPSDALVRWAEQNRLAPPPIEWTVEQDAQQTKET